MKRSIGFLVVGLGLAVAGFVGSGQADVMPSAPVGSPMVEITKRCPNLRYLGRDATFEIVVSNKGNAAANNVVVTDMLPPNAQFVNADGGGQRQGDRVVWNVGTLDAGKMMTFHVTVKCNQIGTVRNTARVAYCVVAEAACEVPVRGIPAMLLECVDSPDPVEVGAETTYTIYAANQGSQTATNIVIECIIPPELEFISAGGATAGSHSGKTVRFAPLPSLAPKSRATYTVTARGIKSGDSRFAVAMTSDQLTTPVNETESTNVYE